MPGRSSSRPCARDVMFVAVTAAVQVVGTTFAARHQPQARPLDAVAYLLLLAGPAALPFRRRWPDAVLVAVAAVTLVWWLLRYPSGPVFLALLITYVTAALRRRWPAHGVLAVTYLGVVVLRPLVRGDPLPSLGAVAGIAAWALLLVAVAEGARQRAAAVLAARQRAAEARRSHEEADRRRASEERLEIARELHDVVGHSLSMINVQAGVALELFDTRPEFARQSLAAIKAASRDAVVDVHAVLDNLRSGPDAAPRRPSATVRDLDALVGRARDAGVAVTTRVDGDPVPLPARIDLVAARIVVEALTNVARHARGSAAQVAVRYRPDGLAVRIEDDGPPLPGPVVEGRGLRGMRERVESLGGSLGAGPRPRGGFRVEASLPLREAP